MKTWSISFALLSLVCGVFIFWCIANDPFEIANRGAEALDGVRYSNEAGNMEASAEWREIADQAIGFLKAENQKVVWAGIVGSTSAILSVIFFLLWRKRRSGSQLDVSKGSRIRWGAAMAVLAVFGLLMMFLSLDGFFRLGDIFGQDETEMSFPNTFIERTKFLGSVSMGFISALLAVVSGTNCFSKR